MSNVMSDTDEIQFSEPILAKKAVRIGVTAAEKTEWEVKDKAVWTDEQRSAIMPYIGNKYAALKLKLTISDDSIETEHANAKPKLNLEDQFNIVAYPFPDKKTGAVRKMGRQKLYELEAAFGFDPCFVVAGKAVDPFITKTGNKVAPKIEGVSRTVNPDFFSAYFNTDDSPKVENWVGKVIYADIGVEVSPTFGAKNVVARYVKAPVI